MLIPRITVIASFSGKKFTTRGLYTQRGIAPWGFSPIRGKFPTSAPVRCGSVSLPLIEGEPLAGWIPRFCSSAYGVLAAVSGICSSQRSSYSVTHPFALWKHRFRISVRLACVKASLER
ncbi:hypothetical protein H5410_052506 [Solanum commersonii]|uniref:Uncharacterized protein n=1 Tax=Solanum commersonii TaxID=4109 RepID=A0A9J5X2D7_SOLCO|nr:hypothetical protein H5410_052506 [Solanum commersonii]